MMEDNKASFNMAVATLARLDGILRRMELVSERMSGLQEQKLQIKLLRHFFANATPLMKIASSTSYENYRTKVLEIKIPFRIIKGKRFEYYSPNLDNVIMELVMDIQAEIKDFFMPPKLEDDDDDY